MVSFRNFGLVFWEHMLTLWIFCKYTQITGYPPHGVSTQEMFGFPVLEMQLSIQFCLHQLSWWTCKSCISFSSRIAHLNSMYATLLSCLEAWQSCLKTPSGSMEKGKFRPGDVCCAFDYWSCSASTYCNGCLQVNTVQKCLWNVMVWLLPRWLGVVKIPLTLSRLP